MSSRKEVDFTDYLPLSAVRAAPGEYDIVDAGGRRLWSMEGAALVEWVCAAVNDCAEERRNADTLQRAIFGPGGWQELVLDMKRQRDNLRAVVEQVASIRPGESLGVDGCGALRDIAAHALKAEG